MPDRRAKPNQFGSERTQSGDLVASRRRQSLKTDLHRHFLKIKSHSLLPSPLASPSDLRKIFCIQIQVGSAQTTKDAGSDSIRVLSERDAQAAQNRIPLAPESRFRAPNRASKNRNTVESSSLQCCRLANLAVLGFRTCTYAMSLSLMASEGNMMSPRVSCKYSEGCNMHKKTHQKQSGKARPARPHTLPRR